MHTPFVLTLLSVANFAISAPSNNCTLDNISSTTDLTWCPCNAGFLCARLDVPLDYQNPDAGRASVPLIKYPAQVNYSYGAYQGMILVNPGGPGGSGVDEALSSAGVVQAVVGSNWDIVGFDPRGIWNSLPLANCSTHTTAKQIPTLISRFVPRVLDKYFNDWIQRGKELGVQCQNTIGGEHDIGPHMSTATVARDMLSIVDAFAQTTEGKTAVTNTSMLNYYGISYGTFLGQTFASMFPQRVGKVVLDGVVNTEGYLTNWTSNAITHIDGIIGAFFIYCHEAGLAKCPYYNGSSAADMYTRFNQSFTQLDPQKAERENWANATILQSALVTMKVGFLSIAQSPLSTFSTFASILVDLETALATQNLSSWVVKASAALGVADTNAPTDSLDEWTLGVLCSDQNNRWYNKTLEDLRPQLAYLEAQSIAGEAWSKAVLGCLGWSIKAAERFAGPFGGDTATPILFVSNTYDSVTAIENSFFSAPRYKGAQVLVVDGMGHTTTATQNTCAFAKMAAYFQTGALPGNDSFCELETGPFGIVLNGTLKENLLRAGLSNLVQWMLI